MECLALKSSSIRTEMQAFKEAVSDDCWVFNVAVQNPDDFSVEYLLDFSNEDVFVEELEEEQQDSVFPDKDFTAEENDNVSTTSSTSCMSEKNELEIELAVPADEEDLENLEWLSRFVDDSLSGFNASLPILFTCFKPERRSELECFKTPIPAKSRSKRSRTGGRVWSLTSPPSFSETSSSSSSSTSSIPRKKAMIPATTEGGGSINQPSRRCSHCGVNKTPQWRAGPNGAKTLCNACGVRYKSGRLVPEYRPACSPTFSSGVYSNHHRKVMEIRRKKENPVMISPAGAAPIMLRSF